MEALDTPLGRIVMLGAGLFVLSRAAVAFRALAASGGVLSAVMAPLGIVMGTFTGPVALAAAGVLLLYAVVEDLYLAFTEGEGVLADAAESLGIKGPFLEAVQAGGDALIAFKDLLQAVWIAAMDNSTAIGAMVAPLRQFVDLLAEAAKFAVTGIFGMFTSGAKEITAALNTSTDTVQEDGVGQAVYDAGTQIPVVGPIAERRVAAARRRQRARRATRDALASVTPEAPNLHMLPPEAATRAHAIEEGLMQRATASLRAAAGRPIEFHNHNTIQGATDPEAVAEAVDRKTRQNAQRNADAVAAL
jgi:hypothetical protein